MACIMKTNEMHFLEIYSDYILYMFRIARYSSSGALLLYMQFMLCIMHSCGLAATTVEMELRSISTVVAAECMIHSTNCMYSKSASWRWISCYSKHVEGVIRIKFKKVHLAGFITQFIMMYGQYNIKSSMALKTKALQLFETWVHSFLHRALLFSF